MTTPNPNSEDTSHSHINSILSIIPEQHSTPGPGPGSGPGLESGPGPESEMEPESDPEPMSAGAAYDAFIRQRQDIELQNSVAQELSKDFRDFRRPSEDPISPRNLVRGGRRLTYDLANARNGLVELAPGREVSLEGRSIVVEDDEDYKEEEEEEEHPPATLVKSAGHSTSSSSSSSFSQPAEKEIHIPSAAEKLATATSPPATSTRTLQHLPPQFQETVDEAFIWVKSQEEDTVLPDHRTLRANVRELLDREEEARRLEFAGEVLGLPVGVDPRVEFRVRESAVVKTDDEQSVVSWEDLLKGVDPRPSFRRNDSERAVTTTSKVQSLVTWEDLLAGVDPRPSFRLGNNNTDNNTLTRTASDNNTSTRTASNTNNSTKIPSQETRNNNEPPKSVADRENHEIPDPTPTRQPQTWMEKLIADYPGGLIHDLYAIFWSIFLLILLPLAIICLIPTFLTQIYRFTDYPCQVRPFRSLPSSTLSEFRPFSFITSLAPSLGLPDCCLLHDKPPPTISPILQDLLGIEHVLSWPITLPHLHALNTTLTTTILPPFTTLSHQLHLSPATTSRQHHAHTLSHSATTHHLSLSHLQTSLSHLTTHYHHLLTSLLSWSHRTPLDLHTHLHHHHHDPFTGTLLLLWGPLLPFPTPVESLKPHLRIPLHDLLVDLARLAHDAHVVRDAVRDARVRAWEFKVRIAEAQGFYVEACGVEGRWWGREGGNVACWGWDPREVARVVRGVGGVEEGVLEEVWGVVGGLVEGVEDLAGFYLDFGLGVLGEGENGEGRWWGDGEFVAMDEVWGFVGELGWRWEGLGEELRVRIGEEEEEV